MGDALLLFVNIRHLNLSKNNLKDIDEIVHLPCLQTLDASENRIESCCFLANDKALKYLQQVNLNKNKVKALGPIRIPNLEKLTISENEIEDAT